MSSATKKAPTETYVLKAGVGQHTIHEGPGEMRTLKAGDSVELTAHQAHAFRDKFEPYSELLARSEVAKRTAEITAALKAEKDKKAEEAQKRTREEAEEALAAQRAKLAEETEGDESEEKNAEADSDTPPAKAASPTAQGKAPVKTIGVTKKK